MVASFLLSLSAISYGADVGSAQAGSGSSGTENQGEFRCQGEFINPISDVCWSCVMPISIASFEIDFTGDQVGMKPPNDFYCRCDADIWGVPIGFYEPARQIDVTHVAYCMVGLGGVSMGEAGNIDYDTNGYISKETATSYKENTFQQVHLYMNPILHVMGLWLDSTCTEQAGYDIAYITEVDPTWNDAEMANLMSPDSSLYESLPAYAACIADCAKTATGGKRALPIAALHWCVGCQGQMYPMMGEIAHHVNTIDSTSLIMTRFMAKMHRQAGAYSYYGKKGFCDGYQQLVMNKQQYKYSMTYPIPQTSGAKSQRGACCQALGYSTWVWGSGRYFPVKGEQYNYLLFRKRDCCQSIITYSY